VKILLLSLLGGAVIFCLLATLIGYGNPWRTVSFTSASGRSLEGETFFLGDCHLDMCALKKQFSKVLIFYQGDGVQGFPGRIKGQGRPPLKLFEHTRRKLFNDPDLLLEAVKSCSISSIHVQYGWHSHTIIIPETPDNFRTVECVKSTLHGHFSAAVGNPLRFAVADTTPFKSLENKTDAQTH